MLRDSTIKYKIALIQMDCILGNIKSNIELATKQIEEAVANGAKLICLPEGFNTGYLCTHYKEMVEFAETMDGDTITSMRQLARKHCVFILAPILFKGMEGIENSAVLIGDEGEIIGYYSKTHLVGDEQNHFVRGTDYPVWNTKIGKIGCVICYDVCFPETVRMLAVKGAEIVLVPAAWRAHSYFIEWWDLNISCRALDNLVYIAAVNRVGSSGNDIFAGKTKICDPIGRVVATAGVGEEVIVYAEIDLSRVGEERAVNTVLEDRHPEDYKLLSNE